MQSETFLLRGTGSAINVELGYIPDRVDIFNATDGDKITTSWPKISMFAFTSASLEIKAGDKLKGATSGAEFEVVAVVWDSGTVAAGDAAGWMLIDMMTKKGTLTTEDFYRISDDTSGANDLTGAVQTTPNVSIDTEAASETGNAGVTPYIGTSGSAAVGITVGSTISEDAKLLIVTAYRNRDGAVLSGRNNATV